MTDHSKKLRSDFAAAWEAHLVADADGLAAAYRNAAAEAAAAEAAAAAAINAAVNAATAAADAAAAITAAYHAAAVNAWGAATEELKQ